MAIQWTETQMDVLDFSTVADGTLVIPAAEAGVVLAEKDSGWIPHTAVNGFALEAGYGYVLFPSAANYRKFKLTPKG